MPVKKWQRRFARKLRAMYAQKPPTRSRVERLDAEVLADFERALRRQQRERAARD